MQNGFVSIALAVLFQNRFAEHLLRHLLFGRQIAGMSEFALVIDWRVDGQTVFQSEIVVIGAVSRGNMHEAGSGSVFDEGVAREKFSGAVAERMLIFELAEVFSIKTADDFVTIPTAFLCDSGHQQRGDNELFLADMDERVAESRVVDR